MYHAAIRVTQKGHNLYHCHGCDTGAKNAGLEKPETVRDNGIDIICPRCLGWMSRSVRGVCISCKNREYEVKKGVNARGKAPVKLREIHTMDIVFLRNGEFISDQIDVAHMSEAALREIRNGCGVTDVYTVEVNYFEGRQLRVFYDA